MEEEDVFPGFPPSLEDGYTQIPNVWFEILMRITNLAELKVVMYVMRNTWGYRDEDGDREEMKTITLDEFVYGRKRKNGTRLDAGTGMALSTVRDGLKRAIKHGYLIHEVDDSDLARVENSYGLKMLPEESDEEETPSDGNQNTGYRNSILGDGKTRHSEITNSTTRSEKETPETNSVEETERERALSFSSFFDEALKFVREKKQVNLYQLERYMHRFIRVRGKKNIPLEAKNMIAWTGSSDEFHQVIMALQAYHSHIKIEFCPESAYSDKGRKPRLPVAKGIQEYKELHWQPMIIIYKD